MIYLNNKSLEPNMVYTGMYDGTYSYDHLYDTNMIIPEGVTRIRERLLVNQTPSKVLIPDSVTSVQMLSLSAQVDGMYIIFKPTRTTVPSTAGEISYSSDYHYNIVVPDALLDEFQNNYDWSSFDNVFIPYSEFPQEEIPDPEWRIQN